MKKILGNKFLLTCIVMLYNNVLFIKRTYPKLRLIVIESEAYKRLVQKIEWIYFYTKKQAKENAAPQPDPSEVWLNDQDAAILRVSKRTMQRLRSNGEITYSIRGNKAWYTLAEVKRLLSGRVVRNDKQEGGKP